MSNSSSNGRLSPQQSRPQAATNTGVSLNDQLKQYIDQVLNTCLAMLTLIQQKPEDGGSRTLTHGETPDVEVGSNQDEQIVFLKQKLRELVDMNVSWQQTHKYNEQRIAELELELQQLKENSMVSGVFSEHQQIEIDRVILDEKKKCQKLEEEKNQLQEKNASLQRDFVELKERLEILEVQLAVNKEDFENERRDRERAQNLLSELQRHVEMLNPNAVSSLQRPLQPQTSCAGQTFGHHSPQPPWSNQRTTGGRYLVDSTAGFDQCDGLEEDKPTASLNSDSSKDQPLQCPNCHRKFTTNQHGQLMDHLDSCGSPS